MKTLIKLFPFAIFLLLVACAPLEPTYHSADGFTGGYADKPAPAGLIKITYLIRSEAKPELINKYALFRAAQLGKQKGKPYFAMYASLDAAAENKKTKTPTIYTSVQGTVSYFYASYHNKKRPGDVSTNEIYNKYSQRLLNPKA